MYVFEAATGRLLWKFNAAPADRKIPVYGSLMSTWPVTTGVLVNDDVAYFAAGIVNYDGVHVYALDARTGGIKWQNNTSGHLDPEARTGVSVQGHMLIHDGKLFLAGGTSISPAVYDLTSGQCLNNPAPLKLVNATSVRGQELYKIGDNIVVAGKPLYADPDHPVYDPSVFNKVFHTTSDARDIIWVNSTKLMCFDAIGNDLLNRSAIPQPENPRGIMPRLRRLNVPESPLWEYDFEGAVAFARCQNVVLLAGNRPQGTPRIEAVDVNNGEGWGVVQLPVPPVPWGLAIDAEGHIIATLEGGQVVCFGPSG